MTPLPPKIAALFPFPARTFETPDGRMHFVDAGTGERGTVVLLHGNPSWAFLWRELIAALAARGFRCIAPDHLGMGLSDKPQKFFRLSDRIAHIEALTKFLGLEKFSLCVHDWGGAIGFGVATRSPEKIERLVVTNTAAFRSPNIPKRIALCKIPGIGPFIVKAFNAFAFPATFMAVRKRLPAAVRDGFLFPYRTFRSRTAVANFVRDIPMSPAHPSWRTLADIETALPRLAEKPMLIAWGGCDFCFDESFFAEWWRRFPNAKTHYCADAGHYLLEDAGAELVPAIADFLSASAQER